MLRYEARIKDFLEDKGIKLKGIENDGRMLVEAEGIQHIYRLVEIDNTLRIYNVYYDRLYTIELN